MAITQAQIDALIQFIDETETAESVTNVIVAAILMFLNGRIKGIDEVKATISALEGEAEDRSAADAELQRDLDTLRDRINDIITNGGLGADDIINSTQSTAADKALAAAQGFVLRRNVVSIQERLDALIRALANSAFKSQRVDELGALSWGAPVTYNISQTLSGCESSHSGSSIDGSVPLTIELTPNIGKILKVANVTATVAGGGSAIVTRDSSTGKVTVYIAVVTGAVSIIASATTPMGYLVTRNLLHCSSSNTSNAFELSEYETELIAENGYTLNGVTPTITMGGVDITSSAWTASTRRIYIPVVTGDIVITATAEETHNPSVTLNLTGCTASNAPQEVEYGNPLELAFTKGNDFVSQYGEGGDIINRGFVKNDFIVMMGGSVLEQVTDYTATQTSSSVVTIRINSVTDDVVISNLVFGDGYMSSGGAINADGSYRTGYTEAHVPIPDDCLSVRIMDGFVGNNTARYICFYDSSKAFKSGVLSNCDGETYPTGQEHYTENSKHPTIISWNADAQANHKYMRCAFYCMTAYGVFSTKCIKDATNGKFIWRASDSATDVIN